MFPSDFDESNHVLDKPGDMDREECDPLCVEIGTVRVGFGDTPLPVVQSCWKLSAEELEEVNRTGRIWLTIVGRTMPPVMLSGSHIKLEH